MGAFSNFAISFSIISILTGAVILYDYGLAWGGPGITGIGWPLVSVFTLIVAAAMAEIASAYPTAGGLYYWSSRLGGPGWGWWTAWLNLGGLIAVVAGIDFAAAAFLNSAVFGLDNEATRYGLSLQVWMTLGLLVVQTAVNVLGSRLVALLNDLSVWVHVAGVLAICLALLAFGTFAHPLADAFTVAPARADPGVPIWGAFLLALLQAQWTYTGYDASAHVAEETVGARKASARGIVLSVAVSAVAGYLLLLALTLRLPPIDETLDNAPAVYYVLTQNLGRLGEWLGVVIALAMVLCGTSALASSGRMLFAFARDEGVPWARKLAHVDPGSREPANAIEAIALTSWLLVAFAFLAGGTAAIAIVTAISTIALYLAYGAPILLGLRGGRAWKSEAAWSLGRLSRPFAVIAMGWIACISVLFVWPTSGNPATWYALLVFLAVLLVYWLAGARRSFTGPRARSAAELAAIEAKIP
jgi:amino acid transporter